MPTQHVIEIAVALPLMAGVLHREDIFVLLPAEEVARFEAVFEDPGEVGVEPIRVVVMVAERGSAC
jgi:hypothetical protein